MPDINGKKINQLDPWPGIGKPTFILGDENGKAWEGDVDLISTLVRKGNISLSEMPSLDFNEVVDPGVYRVDMVNFYMDGYQHSPRFSGLIPSNDPVLEVQILGAYIIQTLACDHALISRKRMLKPDYADYTDNDNNPQLNMWEIWHVIDGYVNVYMPFQTNSHQSATGASLCTNIGNVIMPGRFVIRACVYDAAGTSSLQINLNSLAAYGFPQYPSLSYVGYIMINNDFPYLNDYGDQSHDGILQTSYVNRKIQSGNTTIYMHVRQFSDVTKTFGGWLNSIPTLSNVSKNSAANADNQLMTGTAAIAPVVLGKGVQKQTTAVKGALNYDGNGLYLTLDSGVTVKLSTESI